MLACPPLAGRLNRMFLFGKDLLIPHHSFPFVACPPEIAFELYGNTIWATPIFMRLGKELIVQASLLMEHEHSVKGHVVFEASACTSQYSCIFLRVSLVSLWGFPPIALACSSIERTDAFVLL